MQLWARAQTATNFNNDSPIDQWGTILSPLSVSAFASTPDVKRGGTVSTFGSGSATWASAATGSISLDEGYDFNNVVGLSLFLSGLPVGPGGSRIFDWQYAFLATGNGTFFMGADITAAGFTPGLQGWTVELAGGPEVFQSGGAYQSSDPTGTWNFTGQLTAGSIYTVGLVSLVGLGTGEPRTYHGTMNGVFDWEMTGQVVPTPEPASFALVLSGLIALGGVTRRSRR
jgi:hypothetical protein